MAKPTPEQLAKINRFAKTPMSADDVHVHKFRLIGTSFIPSRFLKFDRSLLDTYLSNLQSGDVAQIFDHSFGNSWVEKVTVPFGRFFEGEIVQDGMETQLDGTMYMTSGVPTYVPGMTTDDIDSQLDSGILHDNSVSVSWGFSECSICHCDIRDYNSCNHYAGKVYEQADGSEVLCYVIAKPAPPPRIDNSGMVENSIVCAGAYLPAGTLSNTPKNEPSGKTGKLNLNNIADLKLVALDAPVFCCLSSTSATFQIESENIRDASELHQLYHSMYSDGLPEGWTMAKLTAKHKESVKELLDAGHEHLMTDALDGTLNESLKGKSKKGSDKLMAMTDEEKLAFDTAIADCGKFKLDMEAKDTEVAELKAKVDELTPNAELGKKYREDSVKLALESGVRDQGNDFQTELYTKMFETLSIDEVNEFKGKWEASALAKLGVPAGHTKGDELNLPGDKLSQSKDPNLFKVGR